MGYQRYDEKGGARNITLIILLYYTRAAIYRIKGRRGRDRERQSLSVKKTT